MKKPMVLLLLAGLGLASSCRAGDGIAIELGRGNSTDMEQISLVRPWDRRWFADGDWVLTGYWEASVARWHGSTAGAQDVWDVGVAPVFRLQPAAGSGLRPYVEGAVGLHLVSHTHVNAGRDMGSAFQFGDHLGAGLVFGGHGQFDLGYRFLHLSNADIKRPNNGINFQQVRFAYHF